eukprot:444722_1
MAGRPTLSTLNTLCDDQTKVLIVGYIRSLCQNAKSINNVNLSHSEIPFQLLPLIVYYFYSSNLFNPESNIQFCQEYNKIWTISQQDGHSGQTLQKILEKNKAGDKIYIYPGEYIYDNNTTCMTFYESVHIIGIGKGVLLKTDMHFCRNATVHLQNLIIYTSTSNNIQEMDQCIDIGSHWKTVSLYLEKCTFMYQHFCVEINEDSSVYINDCLFEGITDMSQSAISLQTHANALTVIGSKFKRCGKCKDGYYTPAEEHTINTQYPCIRIECYGDDIKNNVSIVCIGNIFENNDGHPMAMIVTEDDDDPEWHTKKINYFLADNVINNCMNGQKANECRILFFPQDKII